MWRRSIYNFHRLHHSMRPYLYSNLRNTSYFINFKPTFVHHQTFSNPVLFTPITRKYAMGPKATGMFSNLAGKVSRVMDKLASRKVLTKKDVTNAMKEVRIALLEADVALPVVENFVKKLSEECIGEKVIQAQGLPAAATVYAIVQRNLTELLGSDVVELNLPKPLLDKMKLKLAKVMTRMPDEKMEEQLEIDMKGVNLPATILMTGIQGSGKTTTSAKIAKRLSNGDLKVLLVSLDTRRPAAQEQLATLAKKGEMDYFPILEGENPVDIAKRALDYAKENQYEVVIFDSAGRLHIDEELMQELQEVSEIIQPCETILVADAMLGNDAVNIAKRFHDKIAISGIVLSRLDGDARGGAAISMKEITGVPIKFVGVGEELEQLDLFNPKNIASRILGSGDLATLAERAMHIAAAQGMEEMAAQAEEFKKGKFDFDDYMKVAESMRKLGGLQSLASYLPQSMSGIKERISQMDTNPFELHEQIILQMTPEERQKPTMVISSSAKKLQLAKKAGVQVVEVNKMIKHFEKIREALTKVPNLMEMIKDRPLDDVLKDPVMFEQFAKALNPKIGKTVVYGVKNVKGGKRR